MSISQECDRLKADKGEEGVSSNNTGVAPEPAEDPAEGPSQAQPEEPAPSSQKSKKKSRCFLCKKKVGLTGFDCRCGNLFCPIHRYSDKHDCPYDYRKEAAERIRKENPLVVAEKVKKL